MEYEWLVKNILCDFPSKKNWSVNASLELVPPVRGLESF